MRAIQQKIWILWKGTYQVNIVAIHPQCVTVKITNNNSISFISGVYTIFSKIPRRQLWNHLYNLASSITDEWLIGGDFNIYTNLEDTLGSGQHNIGAITEFSNFFHNMNLIDPGYISSRYTWYNGQEGQDATWERIDKILINTKLLQKGKRITITHFPIHLSDHSPILFNSSDKPNHHLGFKFYNMWTSHESYDDVIKNN